MKCFKCKKEYPVYNYISLRKNEVDIEHKVDLCNNCAAKNYDDEIKELITDGDLKLYEISLCPGFYDCKKIGNLRGRCEHIELLDKPVDPFGIDISHITNPIKWCEPANAGIIGASVRLYELFDNFDKNSTELSKRMLKNSEDANEINQNMLKYTKNMNRLTWVILLFTIVNIILIIYSVFKPN
ncbi:MAG: hypothetical protein FGO69_10970 [Methanobacterium sp.]|nr:MAG: hypothetical protein FGO69_10970 [Methanobacterium sp.]